MTKYHKINGVETAATSILVQGFTLVGVSQPNLTVIDVDWIEDA